MRNEGIFNIKDLVLLGAMNALLVILYYSVIIAAHLIPPLWGFIDPIASFLLAPVYFLMLRLVPKPFVMSIHGGVIGLLHLFTGWWPGLLAGVAAGLVADFTAKLAGGYKRPHTAMLSIPIFCAVKMVLFYAPLYLFVAMPVFGDVVSTWPEEAVSRYTYAFAAAVLGLTVAANLLGLMLGRKMFARHFQRSGMVSL